MKLRYLIVYDENGQDLYKTLQYWNEDTRHWSDVLEFRCSKKDEHKYNTDINLC